MPACPCCISCALLCPERVFHDAAIFDDYLERGLGMFYQADVFERIAVYHQHIGEGALLDDAERTRIGIPRSRHSQQLGVVVRHHF